MARVIAVTFCVTLGASMAARLGATPMAAFQICLQVWMTSSLLADGLAVAGQVTIVYVYISIPTQKTLSIIVTLHFRIHNAILSIDDL